MRNTTTKLLASAAVMALALGTASSAKAFDGVDWQWNKTINQVEDINISVDDSFDWSGLVEIEKIQANIGDVTATSTVHGIDNNPPGNADGGQVLAHFNTPIDLTAHYDDDAVGNPVTDGTINTPGLSASGVTGNVSNNAQNTINLQFTLEGDVLVDIGDIELDGTQDAVDLPSVLSTATAVGNNQNISSTVAVNLDDAQYNFGGFNSETNIQELALLGYADLTDNPHTDGLIGLTLAGALGIITQGSVDATSKVWDIHNASVDSSATAVGNNLNVNVDASTAGDATLIADLTQFNYADVSATSTVCNVDVNNYANLGVLDGPLVSSVATAVGNNVSITVNSPSVGDAGGGGGNEGP